MLRGRFAVHVKPEPAGAPGWLVIAPRRHVEQLDELDAREAMELGALLSEVSGALRQAAGAEKIYLAVFAEILPHLHFHLVARAPGLPVAERGAGLLLAPGSGDPWPAPEARAALAHLAKRWQEPKTVLPAEAAGQARRPRRSLKALLLSLLVCPGAGQWVEGQRLRGTLMAALAVGLTATLAWTVFHCLLVGMPTAGFDLLALPEAAASCRVERGGAILLQIAALSAVWLYSAWDAYRPRAEGGI